MCIESPEGAQFPPWIGSAGKPPWWERLRPNRDALFRWCKLEIPSLGYQSCSFCPPRETAALSYGVEHLPGGDEAVQL